MPYVALETLVDKSCESVYKLVILASKRALEIAEGQPRLSQASASIKPSTVALQEISEGKISCRKLKQKE